MRLFLLPLSTRRTFIYCDKHLRVGSATKRITAGSSANKPRPASVATAAPATSLTSSDQTPASKSSESLAQQYIDKFTDKAATTWADWERAEGGWKKKLTVYGNAALRRIPYEEWGLKSFPTLRQARLDTVTEEHTNKPVNVLFPPSLIKSANVETTLMTLAQERQAMHQKRMWYCLVGAPLTLPFALVPIIPNIPGIYLMFRAWSHYRALYGARYLEFLVQKKLYKATPSQQLDRVYAQVKPAGRCASTTSAIAAATASATNASQQSSSTSTQGGEETVLLTKSAGQEIAKTFEVHELGVELERAVEQVEKAVAKKDSAANEPSTTNGKKTS